MKNKSLKTLVFSLGLAAMMLPANAMAQEDAEKPGGLFGHGNMPSSGGLLQTRNSECQFDGTLGGTTQENPTSAPIGSGIAVLVAAGAGYALLKRKEETK